MERSAVQRDRDPIQAVATDCSISATLFGLGWSLLNTHPYPGIDLMTAGVVYLIYRLFTSPAMVKVVPGMLRLLAAIMVLAVLAGLSIPSLPFYTASHFKPKIEATGTEVSGVTSQVKTLSSAGPPTTSGATATASKRDDAASDKQGPTEQAHTPAKGSNPNNPKVPALQVDDLGTEQCQVIAPLAAQFRQERPGEMYLGFAFRATTFIPWVNKQLANHSKPFRLAEPDTTGPAAFRMGRHSTLRVEGGSANGFSNGVITGDDSTVQSKDFQMNAGTAGQGYIRISCLEGLR